MTTTAETVSLPCFDTLHGVHESPAVYLSRYGHHPYDPHIRSLLSVTGFDDNTGGTVELEAHTHTSGIDLNVRREPVPHSEVLTFGFSLSVYEALALGNALIRIASVTGQAERQARGTLRVPLALHWDKRAPWSGPATCTPACAHAPLNEGWSMIFVDDLTNES